MHVWCVFAVQAVRALTGCTLLQAYYLARGADRRSLVMSSRIRFDVWLEFADLLLGDGDGSEGCMLGTGVH